MNLFEIFLILLITYFLIGWIFCGVIIAIAPEQYKREVSSAKAIKVLAFAWPFLIISFFKERKNK